MCVCIWFKRLYFIWLTKGKNKTAQEQKHFSREIERNRAAAATASITREKKIMFCGALLLISRNVQTFIINIHHYHRKCMLISCENMLSNLNISMRFQFAFCCAVLRCFMFCFVLVAHIHTQQQQPYSMDQKKIRKCYDLTFPFESHR